MNRAEVIARLKNDTTAFELASSSYADTLSPDSPTSAGAVFLTDVRGDLLEAVEYGRFGDDSTEYRGDVLQEIASEAPDTYTHPMWLQFVDLGAYQEEIESGGGDMEAMAREALTTIAYRLADALLTEIEGADTDDDEESEESDETDAE